MAKKKSRKPAAKVPRSGDTIYIHGSYSINHGETDYDGGRGTVSKVKVGISGGEKVHFVEVKEVPGHSQNWEQYLAPDQTKLKKKFGRRKARPNPDV